MYTVCEGGFVISGAPFGQALLAMVLLPVIT